MASVLLVEDNEDHAILAQVALSRCEQKYAVERVASAEECIATLTKKKYDAIVLDYSLPKKNGLALLREIIEISYDAPVVMITSHGDEQIAVEAMKCGAYDYVSKADDYLNKLPRVLQKAIENHELAREKAILQARIEQSVNQLRNIFENVEAGLIEIKEDCKISYANSKAKEYLKIDDDLQNASICKVFSNNGLNPQKCSQCKVKECMEHGGPINCQVDYNNRKYSMTITSNHTEESDGKQLVVVLIDITDQSIYLKQLIQAERLGALGRMASGVAHDFNNVLASILGRAELMLLESSDKGKIDYGLRIIQKSALDGANTVRRIQEFTGVAKQKEFAPIRVNPLVQDVVQMTEPRWKDQSQRDGIRVDVSVQLSSDKTISGNISDLREVLTNIVFNALDAMPEGGSLTFKTYEEDDYACISISDTGSGIPQEVINNIFEPFYTSKGANHSGLGLSVAYGIISRHGGKIEVKSELGKGSEFIIRLPISKESTEIKEKTEAPRRIGNANILTIDDEEAIRELLSNILTLFENKVTTAPDGYSGVSAFQAGKFDIVFTDLGMPGMSGWEVAQRIKAIDPNVKVVLLTGWGVQLEQEQLKEKDIDYVIAKPFQIDQIMEAISSLLYAKN